jgi:N-acetylmuramoyl-L-alanine amidase
MRWINLIGSLPLVCSLWLSPASSVAGSLATSQAKDIECLALNDYHEARGEPTVGRIAVAFVVMNRVHTRGFPKTICGVVNEIRDGRCQFSWRCADGLSLGDARAWHASLALARLMLSPENMIVDPTHGALYYHEVSLNPIWTRSYKFAIKIGSHLFYPKGSEK